MERVLRGGNGADEAGPERSGGCDGAGQAPPVRPEGRSWRGGVGALRAGAGRSLRTGRGGAARHAHYQPPGPAAATAVAQPREQLQPRLLK